MVDFEVEETGGIYSVVWPDTTIRIERLKEQTAGLQGTVTALRTDLPDSHIHEARLNLEATPTVDRFAKKCADRIPAVDWSRLIETACVVVKRAYRKGEPTYDVAELAASDRLAFRLDPFLFERQPNLFYGDGGLGKSTFATLLGVMVSSGAEVGRLVAEPGNVLYLDYEADKEEIRDRTHSISAGLGLVTPPLHYRFCWQPLAADFEQLQQVVLDLNIDFVVVDSAAAACGGKPENAEETLQFFTALRGLRVTSMIVAHINKQNGGKDGAFGSVFWKNNSRSMWEIRSARDAGENELNFSLWHRKVNGSKLHRPFAYRIEFQEQATVFHSTSISASPELARGGGIAKQIEALLMQGAKTSEELAELTQAKPETVRSLLSRNKKRFVLVDGTHWGNAAQGNTYD